ncbi:MAG: hypothetical protein K0R64_1631 [Novosphingobium lindaniclasticum]|nr:hypothetical protein [Novosphingobium lindaniclasticum]
MKTLILVRHGHHAEIGRVLSGRSEIGLDAQGLAQARSLAAALSAVRLASLHSSPQRRALETVAPLARQVDLPVTADAALDEIDFGSFTGKPFESLDNDPEWHCWNAQRSAARCPGGETMTEAAERAIAYVEGLEAPAFPALLVTHCDIIRALAALTLGRSLDALLELPCEPASRTTFDVANGHWRLLALNEATLIEEDAARSGKLIQDNITL